MSDNDATGFDGEGRSDDRDSSGGSSGGGSRETLLVSSKVRAAVKASGHRMDGTFVDALNERVHELISRAGARADAAKRATVRPEDL